MKNKFMMIRATEEEKNIAQSKAKELGMSLSAFVRFLIRQWELPYSKRHEGFSYDGVEKPPNQQESKLWVIFDFLYALYLKIRRL